jgi:hypothetical protein
MFGSEFNNAASCSGAMLAMPDGSDRPVGSDIWGAWTLLFWPLGVSGAGADSVADWDADMFCAVSGWKSEMCMASERGW